MDSLDVSDISRTFKVSTKFSNTQRRNPLEPNYGAQAALPATQQATASRRSTISSSDIPFSSPTYRTSKFATRDSNLNISDIAGARPRQLHVHHRNRGGNPESLQSSDIAPIPYPNQKALSKRVTDIQSPRYNYPVSIRSSSASSGSYGAIEKVHPNPGRQQRQAKNLFAGTTLGIPEASPQWKFYSQPVRRHWRDINQTKDIPGAQVPQFSAVALRKTGRRTNPNDRNYNLDKWIDQPFRLDNDKHKEAHEASIIANRKARMAQSLASSRAFVNTQLVDKSKASLAAVAPAAESAPVSAPEPTAIAQEPQQASTLPAGEQSSQQQESAAAAQADPPASEEKENTPVLAQPAPAAQAVQAIDPRRDGSDMRTMQLQDRQRRLRVSRRIHGQPQTTLQRYDGMPLDSAESQVVDLMSSVRPERNSHKEATSSLYYTSVFEKRARHPHPWESTGGSVWPAVSTQRNTELLSRQPSRNIDYITGSGTGTSAFNIPIRANTHAERVNSAAGVGLGTSVNPAATTRAGVVNNKLAARRRSGSRPTRATAPAVFQNMRAYQSHIRKQQDIALVANLPPMG